MTRWTDLKIAVMLAERETLCVHKWSSAHAGGIAGITAIWKTLSGVFVVGVTADDHTPLALVAGRAQNSIIRWIVDVQAMPVEICSAITCGELHIADIGDAGGAAPPGWIRRGDHVGDVILKRGDILWRP